MDQPHDRVGTSGVDLDDLLRRASPPVSAGDPAVRREVDAVVESLLAARSAGAGRSRAPRRWAVGAGAVVLAFAGTSVAAAAPGAPAWLAWADFTPDATITDPPGSCTVVGLRVVPDGAGVGDQDPAVLAGAAYLAQIEPADVDFSQELADQRTATVVLEDGSTTTGAQQRSEEEMVDTAFNSALTGMVFEEVRRQGLDGGRIAIEGRGEGCSYPGSR